MSKVKKYDWRKEYHFHPAIIKWIDSCVTVEQIENAIKHLPNLAENDDQAERILLRLKARISSNPTNTNKKKVTTMKSLITIITAALILLITQTGFAQITVKSQGRTVVLSERNLKRIKASGNRLAIAAINNTGRNGTIKNNDAADVILKIIARKKGCAKFSSQAN